MTEYLAQYIRAGNRQYLVLTEVIVINIRHQRHLVICVARINNCHWALSQYFFDAILNARGAYSAVVSRLIILGRKVNDKQ